MMFALSLDKNNRILCATYPEYQPSGIMVEFLPDGDISDYKYIGKKYIYDPLPKPIEPEPKSKYVTYDELDKMLKAGVNSI